MINLDKHPHCSSTYIVFTVRAFTVELRYVKAHPLQSLLIIAPNHAFNTIINFPDSTHVITARLDDRLDRMFTSQVHTSRHINGAVNLYVSAVTVQKKNSKVRSLDLVSLIMSRHLAWVMYDWQLWSQLQWKANLNMGRIFVYLATKKKVESIMQLQ